MWTTGQRTVQQTLGQITSTAKEHWYSNLERLAKRLRSVKRREGKFKRKCAQVVFIERLEADTLNIKTLTFESCVGQIYTQYGTSFCFTTPKCGAGAALQASE